MANNKILVIDDEEAIRKTVRTALRDSGNELLFAENGKEGLELYNDHHPALVILDIKMPVMDGIEFLKHLKLSLDVMNSIIVLTAHGDLEEIGKCADLGVGAFLAKPFNFNELNQMIINIVGGEPC